MPDGASESWFFDSNLLDDEVVIDIDLRDVHPLLVRGVMLGWDGNSVPRGYSVAGPRAVCVIRWGLGLGPS